MMLNSYAAAGLHGGHVMRIRAPSFHDVLSGRGGDINSHSGNVQFRGWVRARKNAYSLAASKAEKVRIATEVIDLVKSRGGRFLQKDPKSVGGGSAVGSWWIEMNEDKAIAKTSQALREGSPQIRRAANRKEQHPTRQRQQQPHAKLPLTPTCTIETTATVNPANPAVVTSPESSPLTPPKSAAAVLVSSPGALLQSQQNAMQRMCSWLQEEVEGGQQDDSSSVVALSQTKRPIIVIDGDDDEDEERPEKRARMEDAPRNPASITAQRVAVSLPLLPCPTTIGDQRYCRRPPKRSQSLDGVERMLELSDLESKDSKTSSTTPEFVNPFEDEMQQQPPYYDPVELGHDDADAMLSNCSSNGSDYYPGEHWFDDMQRQQHPQQQHEEEETSHGFDVLAQQHVEVQNEEGLFLAGHGQQPLLLPQPAPDLMVY